MIYQGDEVLKIISDDRKSKRFCSLLPFWLIGLQSQSSRK